MPVQCDKMAQDYKRSLAKLQLDNDRLDQELNNFSDKERQLLHQLKETEDRVGLLVLHFMSQWAR